MPVSASSSGRVPSLDNAPGWAGPPPAFAAAAVDEVAACEGADLAAVLALGAVVDLVALGAASFDAAAFDVGVALDLSVSAAAAGFASPSPTTQV